MTPPATLSPGKAARWCPATRLVPRTRSSGGHSRHGDEPQGCPPRGPISDGQERTVRLFLRKGSELIAALEVLMTR